MIWKIIYFAVIIVICYFAGRISKKITDLIFSNRLKNVINNEAKVKTLKTVTTSVFKFGIYLVAVLSVLVQLGVSPTALTAISGSIAVAIGLGAQNVVSDIIAGIFILVEDQFRVGDIVTINGCTGTVENVTIRTTRLRDIDGTVYIVPNGTISTITNKCRDFMNAMVDVGVAYEEDAEHVIEVLKDEMNIAGSEVKGLQDIPNVLGIVRLDDSSVTIRIVAKCDVKENYGVERELRLRIKKRFDAEGISIPYPQRTVHLVSQEEKL